MPLYHRINFSKNRVQIKIFMESDFLLNRNVEFAPPDISEKEIRLVTEVLRSGWITTGPRTKLFEKKIAEYCGTKMAVCMNSATACLEMTLRLLGIGEGDEVITTSYTYTASCSVILHVGAKPILIDTAKGSFEMDYEKLSRAITKRTKAIIPVDIFGIMCDYDKIFEAVELKKDLFQPSNNIQKKIGRVAVIADAAHAFGAMRNGKKCGEVADFTCFSFHAVKNLTTAEGGAVLWKDIDGIDNEEIYKEYMLFSLHGQTKDALNKSKAGAWEYDIKIPGYKCNMTDISAALGLVQLERYEKLLKRRGEIVSIYERELMGKGIELVRHRKNDIKSSMHLYPVRLIGKDEQFRNMVIDKMAQAGVATNVHYKPLPMFTAYKRLGFSIADYKNAFEMYKNEITLPLHTHLTDEDAEYTSRNLIEILNKI